MRFLISATLDSNVSAYSTQVFESAYGVILWVYWEITRFCERFQDITIPRCKKYTLALAMNRTLAGGKK